MPAKKKDDRSLKALEATAELFVKKPKASTEEFREVAEKADSSVKKLSPRSFNAKYVLPLKRSAAAAKGKGKTAAKKAAERITAKAAGKKTKKKTRRKAKRTTKRKTKRTTKRAVSGDGEVSAAAFNAVKKLVQQRDKQLMDAADDASKAYEFATGVDSFVEKVVKELR